MSMTTKRLRTDVATYKIQSTVYSERQIYIGYDVHTIDVLLLRHYDTMALSHMIWLM